MFNCVESEIVCLMKEIFTEVLREHNTVTNIQKRPAWRSESCLPSTEEIFRDIFKRCSVSV